MKVRGYRIELTEIENKLNDIPEVRACAVVTQERRRIKLTARDARESGYINSKHLVGYVSVNGQITRNLLIQKLKMSLPDYMIPDYFVLIDRMPHNSNGKIDYNQLKNKTNIRPLTDSLYEAPGNEMQRRICEIYANITNTHPVGIKDKFVEIGGDSLRSMMAVNQIAKEFSVNIQISDIYAHNVEALEKKIGNLDTRNIELKPYPSLEQYPLSQIQKQLWFLWKLSPGLKNYTLQVEISCDENIDPTLFKNAWRMAVNYFDTLRMQFGEDNGNPYFRIRDDGVDYIKETYIAQSGHRDVEAYRESVMSQSIDLLQDELFRLDIVSSDASINIFLTTHEIVMDAWSLSVLVKYITKCYRALRDGIAFPEKAGVGYKDYTLWESEHRNPQQLKQEADFWRAQLSGEIEFIKIPRSHEYDRNITHLTDALFMSISPESVQKINEISINENITKYTIILSAFYILLNQFSGNNDLIVGSPHVVRDVPGTEELLGFFLNMIPMRVKLDRNKSFIEICRDVHSVVSNSISNGAYPFSAMVEDLNISRSESYHPIFQIMFNMYSERSEERGKDVNFYAREKDNGYAKYDLVLYCQEESEEILLQFSYAKDLFDAVTIDRLSSQLNHIFNICLSHERTAIGSLDLVNQANQSMKQGEVVRYDEIYHDFDIYESFIEHYAADKEKIAF